jgi:hypothetical protein
MKQPTEIQINQVKNIIKQSIQDLIRYDSDIFHNDVIEPEDLSNDAKLLNRKLHETTINHRIAYYFEKYIQNTDLSFYKVDIEYNRDNWRPKELQTVEGLLVVRPDILIHTRMDDSVAQQHFLAVEAKKENITQHDVNKIEGFISDGRFHYLFGLTISYCIDKNDVLSNLFYFDGNRIFNEPVNISKKVEIPIEE